MIRPTTSRGISKLRCTYALPGWCGDGGVSEFEFYLNRLLGKKTHTENVLGYVKANCNNIDDLNKIYSAVEAMLEELELTPPPATLKQLLIQSVD